jgi:predicted SprT family Zn-dependent metalloprotease
VAETLKFENQLNALARKWREFFSNPPYPYIPVEFNSFEIHLNWKMRSRAGLCKPYEGVIELNPNLLQDEKILEEVFIHELCHLVVSRRWPRAQAHGERWKKLMTLCGMKPLRCHNLVPEKRHLHRRWDLKCACQVHKVTTLILNRIKRGQRYKCKGCGVLLQA